MAAKLHSSCYWSQCDQCRKISLALVYLFRQSQLLTLAILATEVSLSSTPLGLTSVAKMADVEWCDWNKYILIIKTIVQNMRTIIMRSCWTLCIKLRFVSRVKEWKSSLFLNVLCWQVIRNVLNSCLGMCYHREDWPGKQTEMHQKKPPCPRELRSTTTKLTCHIVVRSSKHDPAYVLITVVV